VAFLLGLRLYFNIEFDDYSSWIRFIFEASVTDAKILRVDIEFSLDVDGVSHFFYSG